MKERMFIDYHKRIQTLNKLGLTPLESQIYIASLSREPKKIGTISRIANVDRSNAHHAIKKLLSIGLVTEILGTPKLYQAIPIEEGTSVLLKNKKQEFKQIMKEAAELSEDFNTKNHPLAYQEPEFQLYKRQRDTLIKEMISTTENMQESLDLIVGTKVCVSGLLNLSTYHLNCIKRGVKYRIITEKTIVKYIDQLKPFLLLYPNFVIRFMSQPYVAGLAIQDKKKGNIYLTPNSELGDSFILFSNNRSLLCILQDHFDTVWSKAKDVNENA